MSVIILDLRTFRRVNKFSYSYYCLLFNTITMILKRMFKFLRTLDNFGAGVQLHIFGDEEVYRSTFGGIMTIIIYALTLAYTIQIGYQWLNWEILPTVNMQSHPTGLRELVTLQSSLFRLSFVNEALNKSVSSEIKTSQQYKYTQGSVFRDRNESNFQIFNNKDSCDRPNYQQYTFAPLCQNVSDFYQNHLYSPDDQTYGTFLYFWTKYCDLSDPKCYHKDVMMKSANNGAVYWELLLFREEVDLTSGKVFQIKQPYFLLFDNDTEKYLNIQLKVTKAEVSIDNGFLFSDLRTFTIIKDVQPLITLDKSFIQNQGPQVTISTNNYYIHISISFPQITIILSQILSFFQTISLLGYIVVYHNSGKLSNYITQTLLDIYFPQFKLLKQNKPHYSQSKTMKRAETLLGRQKVPELYEHREKICKLLQGKLNLFQLISEINQLQLAVRMFELPKNQKHYRLSFLNDLQKYGIQISNTFSNDSQRYQYPNQDDFYNFMSIPQKKFVQAKTSEKIYPIPLPTLEQGQLRSQDILQVISMEASQRLQ